MVLLVMAVVVLVVSVRGRGSALEEGGACALGGPHDGAGRPCERHGGEERVDVGDGAHGGGRLPACLQGSGLCNRGSRRALHVLGVPIASIAKFPSRCELLPSRRSWDARSVCIFCSRMHGF